MKILILILLVGCAVNTAQYRRYKDPLTLKSKFVDGRVKRVGQHIYIADAHSYESLEDAIMRSIYKVAKLYQSRIVYRNKLTIGSTMTYESSLDGETQICTRKVKVLGQKLPSRPSRRPLYAARTKVYVDPHCKFTK